MSALRLGHLTTIDMSLALLLAAELRADLDAGYEVFGLSAPGPYVPMIEELGVIHVPLSALSRSWSPRSDARAAAELWRRVRDLDLDVLHTHTPKAGVLGRVIGRLARVPVVVNTCHGLFVKPDDHFLKKIAVYGAEAFAARFSHAELFQNAADEQAMRRFIPAGRRAVVGNGIDLERFGFDPVGRSRVREEWDVGPGELLVGGVGRLVEEKGVLEFVTAARALTSRARFVWVGPRDAVKADAVAVADASVHFVGERRDMPAVYSAFDVFVLPSHREGFSRSAMEAAACGRAMVLTDVRGCREIGTHGEQLLLVPPRDPQALIGAITLLLEDGELRSRLGAAALRRAAAFDQSAVARASLATYERVRGMT